MGTDLFSVSGGLKGLLVDVSGLMFRSFYVIKRLTTSENFPTNAIFGTLKMLVTVHSNLEPDFIVPALDHPGERVREKEFAEYKAQREEPPSELVLQFQEIGHVLEALGATPVQVEGWEADDVLGSIAAQDSEDELFVLTSDRDLLQLLRFPHVKVMLAKKGVTNFKTYTASEFVKEYGFPPELFPDFKALCGDPSDNVPGVESVGPKTARRLVAQFGTVENLLENLHTLPPKLAKKVEEAGEKLLLYKRICTINTSLPVPPPNELRSKNLNFSTESAKNVLRKLEFYSFLGESPRISSRAETPPVLFAWKNKVWVWQNGGVKEWSGGKPSEEWWCADGKALCKLTGWREFPENCVDGRIAFGLLNGEEPKGGEETLFVKVFSTEDPTDFFNPAPLAEMRKRLETEELWNLYSRVELPIVPAVAKMELNGIYANPQCLEELKRAVSSYVEGIKEEIKEKTGGVEVNLNSPKQLSHLLYDVLALPPVDAKRSTKAEVLEKLFNAHPVVPLIMEYRTHTKLLSGFIEPLLEKASKGRVHAVFHQIGAATGRMSSEDPNLQNIPVRHPLGVKLRDCFVGEGANVLLSADYSQIELRVLAHLSEDENLMSAFERGEDIHASTASRIFHVPIEEVTPEQRRSAKVINFGIIYGMSPYGLARELNISDSEAKEYIENYFAKFPRVREFTEACVEEAKKHSYVRTMFGRKRYLGGRELSNKNLFRRIAINTKIQGSAADIIKVAMGKLWKEEPELSSHLLLQIHDELLFEVPPDRAEDWGKRVEEVMESCVELKVPLEVKVSWGKRWGDLK